MKQNPTPQIRLYTDWLQRNRGLDFPDYESLWRWSVTDLDGFWRSIWEYNGLISPTEFDAVLSDERMPRTVWFEGAEVNYANQVFRHVEAAEAVGQPALICENERGQIQTVGWRELRQKSASLALTLRDRGIRRGDRVVAYLPNGPEAVIAFLACVSLGAIWSVCAPDMGPQAILERFRQIGPKALIAVDGVRYAGKNLDRSALVRELRQALSSVETLVLIETPEATERLPAEIRFAEALDRPSEEADAFMPEFVPFDHPLWVVYSSGTTGLPKPIVHGHGGVLLMTLAGVNHLDLGPSYETNTFGERFHWYSSTGWIMWNIQVSGLLSGTTICLFDGSPNGAKGAEDWGLLWRFASCNRVTMFGAGAAFYTSCMKNGLDLSACGDLSSIRVLGSTGSPLPREVEFWGSEQFAALGTPAIRWFNISGGTDIYGGFVTGHPELPPAPGRIQCRHLGAAVEAWNEEGKPVIGEVGELVCVKPLPSMPITFWNDEGDARYLASYFDTFPGVWRHGDWLTIDETGVCTISGRSDATINRHGLRMGTSEIYAAVESLPEISDSLVIDLDTGVGESQLLMFVTLAQGASLGQALLSRIAEAIRTSLSPRFVPDEVIAAPGVPRTLSGKKQEVPMKRILQGMPAAKALTKDAMANPEVIDWYLNFAAARLEQV